METSPSFLPLAQIGVARMHACEPNYRALALCSACNVVLAWQAHAQTARREALLTLDGSPLGVILESS